MDKKRCDGCRKLVPLHVSPKTCRFCKTTKISVGTESTERKKRPLRKICEGICGRHVPLTITPEICIYCKDTIQIKCLRCKIVIHTISGRNYGNWNDQYLHRCKPCYEIEYPLQNCECGKTFRSLFGRNTKCSDCREEIKKCEFLDLLNPIDEEYLLKIKIKVEKTIHTGYCSWPEIEKKKIKKNYYFPAPSTCVSNHGFLELLMKYFENPYLVEEYHCCSTETDFKEKKLKYEIIQNPDYYKLLDTHYHELSNFELSNFEDYFNYDIYELKSYLLENDLIEPDGEKSDGDKSDGEKSDS